MSLCATPVSFDSTVQYSILYYARMLHFTMADRKLKTIRRNAAEDKRLETKQESLHSNYKQKMDCLDRRRVSLMAEMGALQRRTPDLEELDAGRFMSRPRSSSFGTKSPKISSDYQKRASVYLEIPHMSHRPRSTGDLHTNSRVPKTEP